MSRFFVNSNEIYENEIKITGEDYNHIKNVLRMRVGDPLVICDGQGIDYQVVISRYETGCVYTSIISSSPNMAESQLNVTLFQGIPKSDKMDYIIQKSVELGASAIVPVVTERTVVKIKDEKDAIKKVERWQKISKEAAKQCGRGIIPKVEMPVSFSDAVNMSKNHDLAIIPYEKENKTKFKDILTMKDFKSVAIFIGPEGGFGDNEVNAAEIAGIKPISLGPRILRTETAGIAALSIVMFQLGDMS